MPHYEVTKVEDVRISYAVLCVNGTQRTIHRSFDELSEAEYHYKQCKSAGVYDYSAIQKVVRVRAVPEDVVVVQDLSVQ